MSLTPLRPLGLSPWFDRFIEEFEEPFGLSRPRERHWLPAVDIEEDEKAITIKADIPDMDRKDINVSVSDGYLVIRGERKSEKKEENKKYHRVERRYGAFERSFALPESVDQDKVSADYKDGALKVTIPKTKAEPAKGAKTVEIK